MNRTRGDRARFGRAARPSGPLRPGGVSRWMLLFSLLAFLNSAMALPPGAFAHAFEAREHTVFAEYGPGGPALIMHHVGEADAHETAAGHAGTLAHVHTNDHVYELSDQPDSGLAPAPADGSGKTPPLAALVPVGLAYPRIAVVTLRAQPPPLHASSTALLRTTRLLL